MSRAVLPEMAAHDAWLLLGLTQGDVSGGRHAPCLENDAMFDNLEPHPEAATADFSL